MEVRTSNWNDRSKPTWPEYSGNKSIEMNPALATIVERATLDGKPSVLLSSIGPGGNMVVFRLTEADWIEVNTALAENMERWVKERMEALKP